MGLLEGKVAIVTGSGSGIGRATAQRLAVEGASVVVADINPAGAKETVGLIEGAGGRAVAQEADVSSEESVAAMVQAAVDNFGGLHCLHNNAADVVIIQRDLDIVGMEVEVWDRTMVVNLRGAMLGMKHAIPRMIEAGGGSIVNTSSLAAFLGTPDLSAYGASKGAVRQFTKTVAIDCARKGYKVRCNSVHPGIILTPMGNAVMPNDKARERARRRIPIGDFGAPEDIAYGILYLISDESRFVTGTELVIDGGMNAI
jgi:3(or 17)beta-hydroxysteroid dehydrogenase